MTLPKRAKSVLYAVVTEFIATAEAVGSRTLTKKYGFSLSPATIRNVLADLEEAGYLMQPHTSAGRVPTEAGLRLFVDALMHERRLTEDDATKLSDWFQGLPPGADVVRETGKLLSDLSGAPAVLVRARSENRTLLKIRFICTRPGEVLSVIVFSDGTVENRFIHVEQNFPDSELERVHHMLEEIVPGRTLSDVREHLVERMARERDELVALRTLGYSLVQAASQASVRGSELLIEGQSRLLDRPEFGSVDRARDLMRALDDRERLLTLLDRTLVSSRVQVFLSDEAAELVGCPVSLVVAPFSEQPGEPGGAIGVIGPNRMDYPTLVPLVAAMAEGVSEALTRLGRQRPS